MEDKEKVREFYLAKRRKIENIAELSDKIAGNLSEFLSSHGRGKIWASYRSFGYEVDLSRLNLKNNFAYPKIMPSGNMEFFLASLVTDEWVRSEFGFLEPASDCDKLNLENVEGILFPAVSYDYFGNRIGYGQGFYDKTLKTYKGIKVGVCFSAQVSKESFKCVTNEDVKVNYIVTEKGCFESRELEK